MYSYSYGVAVNEKRSYMECANRQLTSCNEALNGAVAKNLAEVNAAQTFNADLLNRAKDSQTKCSLASTTVQSALGAWQRGGTDQIIRYNKKICPDPSNLKDCSVSCSQDAASGRNGTCTCAAVAKKIGDISTVRSEAYGHTIEFASDSKSTVGAVARFTRARSFLLIPH